MAHFGYFAVDLFDCPPFQMFFNDDDPRAEDILVSKRFEPQSMALWCRYARRATSIIDIGAHSGVYSLAAASLRKDVQIHAFEPNPLTAARLIVNRNYNAFDNLLPYPLALGNKSRMGQLSWSPRKLGWLSSSSTVNSQQDRPVKVPVQVLPLDRLMIAYGSLPLVKIDVEGQEEAVVSGMRRLLEHRPIVILESFDQSKCDGIAELLPGYHCFRIIESGGLEPLGRLTAADRTAEDFNQLLLPNTGLL